MKNITTNQIVNEILCIDAELKATYKYYQAILHAIDAKDEQTLRQLLDHPHEDISEKMKTACKSLNKFIEPVVAALETNYTNASLEGTITLIKTIKRVAFGYRSFYHFRIRIMLILDFNPIKKQREYKARFKLQKEERLERQKLAA